MKKLYSMMIILTCLLISCSGNPNEGIWMAYDSIQSDAGSPVDYSAHMKITVNENDDFSGVFSGQFGSFAMTFGGDITGHIDESGAVSNADITMHENGIQTTESYFTGTFHDVNADGDLVVKLDAGASIMTIPTSWILYKNDPASPIGTWEFRSQNQSPSWQFNVLLDETNSFKGRIGMFLDDNSKICYGSVSGSIDGNRNINNGTVTMDDSSSGSITGNFGDIKASGEVSIPALSSSTLSWSMNKEI
ncbi:MAG: hypothetical protein GY754_15625 [bacterium]|nr:hypothetical protein [bacterium]